MPEETFEFDPVQARRDEVAQYDTNIATYQTILADLPTEWPAHLEPHRHPKNPHTEAHKIENLDDLAMVSRLWFADEMHARIRSEIVERTKAAAILAALES
jgi:hypothetical protein